MVSIPAKPSRGGPPALGRPVVAILLLAACGGPATPADTDRFDPVPAEWPDTASPDEAFERGRFLLLRSADTVAIEEFRRGPGVTAFLLRVRGGPTLRMEASVAPDARVAELAIRLLPAGGSASGPAPLDLLVSFSGASVAVQRATRGAGRTIERRDVRRGTLPWSAPSVVLLELLVRRARGARLGVVPLYDAVGGGETLEAFVTPLGRDSALVRVREVEYRLAVDADGRVVGGRVMPGGMEIRREALSGS